MRAVEQNKPKSPLDGAAERLRQIALAKPEGELIGSEDDLLEMLQVSRVTARQAARLLEGEGLVRVRRGTNGGYFAARPDPAMIEAVVCSYLSTLGLEARHTGAVATALWVETLREAAAADPDAARALAKELSEKISQLDDDATILDVSRLEQECRLAIFELIGGGYIQLIFRINVAFSRQQADRFANREPRDGFAKAWKKCKLMELEAIADGDQVLAMMAAMHTRNLWTGRDTDGQRDMARLVR